MADQAPGERPVFRRGVRLALDIGKARIGVARCDADGLLSVPVETIHRKHHDDGGLRYIGELVEEFAPLEVVVGDPIDLQGESGIASQSIRAFTRGLARRLPHVTFRLVDERLTTAAAHRELSDAGISGRDRQAMIDQAAAVQILETAIAWEKKSGTPAGTSVGEKKTS